MEINNLFHERYFLERLLGRGNFSEVWLAKDTKTDIQVALKIYAPATGLDDNGLNIFAREFALVVNANHKSLLKPLYYDSYERKPYLVLPYCKNGSIMKLIGQFSEQEAWKVLRDVASGLAWLHHLTPPVIHQDIKPDNIMIGDNDNYMITDFGVSTHLKSTLRKSISSAFSSAGTIAYMAPERFSEDNTPIMANDIYSLGATVFEMLSGDTPFGDEGGLLQKRGADVPILKGEYSGQLKKVVGLCLKTNPWERPTAEQLEEYAEMAIAGKTIKFHRSHIADGKKRKWAILSASLVAVVIVIAAIIVMLGSGKEDAPQTLVQLADTAQTKSPVVESVMQDSIRDEEDANSENTSEGDMTQGKKVPRKKEASPKKTIEEEKENVTQDITPIEPPKQVSQDVALSLSQRTLRFKGKSDKIQKVEVFCGSSNWKVSKCPSWAHYKVRGDEIEISVDKNDTKVERSGILVVKCGEKTISLNIIQARIKALGIL